MKKKKDVLFLILLITIVVFYSIVPIVARIFSDYFTTYAYMGVILVVVALVIVSRRQDSFSEFVVLLIPFIIWKIVIYFVNRPELMIWGYTSLLDFAPIVIGYFILDRLGYKDSRYFAVLVLTLIFATMITSIVGLNIHPDASRILATIEDTASETFIEYNYMNIGGYEFVYTVALIYPLMIYGFKRRKFHWAVLLAYALLDFSLIINSGYTTALLLFIFSSVFVFLPHNIGKKTVFAVLGFAIVFTLLFFPLISELLNFIGDRVDNIDIAYRLHALAGGRQGLESSEDNRLALYMISFNSFLDHPLFGGIFTGAHKIGGHSFILDFVSQYGLVGVAILVACYRVVFKTFIKPNEKKEGYGFIFWTFVQALFLSTVNTGMWLYVLCLYAPVVIAFIDGKGEVNENILGRKLTIK